MQLKFGETESMQTYIDHIPLYIGFSVYARPCDCSICDSGEHIDCIMCENCKKNYYEDHIGQKFESDSDIERFLKHMKHKCSCGNKMELTENLIRRLSSLKTR